MRSTCSVNLVILDVFFYITAYLPDKLNKRTKMNLQFIIRNFSFCVKMFGEYFYSNFIERIHTCFTELSESVPVCYSSGLCENTCYEDSSAKYLSSLAVVPQVKVIRQSTLGIATGGHDNRLQFLSCVEVTELPALTPAFTHIDYRFKAKQLP